ncbi:MAG: glycosyltransferase, partial [Eubacteriales bacterium]|nr:glycosyltransferase [Eubacteriales bacterium]
MNILIANNNMEVGGIQKSLVNLLKEISKEHKVTLFLFSPTGELMSDVPDNVNVIQGNFCTRILGINQGQAKHIGFATFLWRSIWASITKTFGIRFAFYILTRLQKIHGEYDVAISYMQNSAYRYFYGGANEFVLNSIKAKEKIAFFHCDFEKYYGNNKYNISLYERFDKLAAVSDGCKNAFLRICPQYKGKTYTVHNMYDFSGIKDSSLELDVRTEKTPFIFTSARISEEKGILRMFPIFSKIKRDGYDFIWYIAGDGPDAIKAKDEAQKNNVDDNVVFLGMLKNPYPYFKACDFLLVPSYNEAAPMVFGEALSLNTPVFTTDTISASELVGNINGGWIV